jgi:chemotaxis methyl-accepting protein methylase
MPEILKMSFHGSLLLMAEKLRQLTDDEVSRLARWFKEEMGLELSFYRPDFISRRFLPRASALGCKDLESYIDFLRTNERERRLARKRLLVSTTELFRNQDVFDSLSGYLKNDADAKNWKDITVLSAPCSTGEEALSLAIFFDCLNIKTKVLAIDRNISSLRQISKAKFPARALQKLDKFVIKRYFKEEGSYRTLEDNALKRVFPLCCDLKFQMPVKRAHVVFMRNFFIYLTEEAQKLMVENVRRVLVDGGLLVLGKVERLNMNSAQWDIVDIGSKIYRLKRGRR